MRRHTLAATGAALLIGAVLAGCGGDDSEPTSEPLPDSDAYPAAEEQGATELSKDIAAMRAGTAKYVTDPSTAQEDGFVAMTQMVEDTGVHFLNPTAPEEFDPSQPSMLVYDSDGDDAQLTAVGWVFTEEPAESPVEGATYGSFPAACHYQDGSYIEENDENACADSHPDGDAPLSFWHPDLTTLHAWAWMPNPEGLFAATNPLMSTFNEATGDQPSGEPTTEPTEGDDTQGEDTQGEDAEGQESGPDGNEREGTEGQN